MLRVLWILTISIGLSSQSLGQQLLENDGIVNEAESAQVSKGISGGREEQHRIQNRFSRQLVYSGFVSNALVLVGTIALIWTLFETRKATRAAIDAVEVTRNIGQTQLRAYASSVLQAFGA